MDSFIYIYKMSDVKYEDKMQSWINPFISWTIRYTRQVTCINLCNVQFNMCLTRNCQGKEGNYFRFEINHI